MFDRVRDQFVDDQRRRNRAIGRDHDPALGLDVDVGYREAGVDVPADRLDVAADVQPLDIRSLKQLIVNLGDRPDAARRLFEMRL